MNNDMLQQRGRFVMIGILMAIIGLMFLFYMGSSLVCATREYVLP